MSNGICSGTGAGAVTAADGCCCCAKAPAVTATASDTPASNPGMRRMDLPLSVVVIAAIVAAHHAKRHRLLEPDAAAIPRARPLHHIHACHGIPVLRRSGQDG